MIEVVTTEIVVRKCIIKIRVRIMGLAKCYNQPGYLLLCRDVCEIMRETRMLTIYHEKSSTFQLSFGGSSFPIKILYDIFTQTNIYLENVERFFLRNLLSKADSYNDRPDLR